MKKKLGYRDLPIIPSRVYRILDTRILRGIVYLSLFIFFFYKQFTIGDSEFLLCLVIAIAFFDLIKPFNTVSTDITKTTVSAQFENGDKIEEEVLTSYVIYIKEGWRSPSTGFSKNYKYAINLVHKSKVSVDGIQLSPQQKDTHFIALVDAILCPINLKEWVESFQRQIETPLPIIFASEKLLSDYHTGIFRSLEKQEV